MKNRNTLWLFCLATAIFFACSEDSKTELLTPEISSEIPPDFDLSNPVHMESNTQIAELHHAFYFIDADNYLYPFDGGALTCPDTYDYHAAEYVAFDDLMYFSGMIAMEFDTLIIQEGVVFQKKPDSPAPGRPECKEGEIRQSGTAGKISKEEKCTTRRGKKGTGACIGSGAGHSSCRTAPTYWC